MPDSATPAQGTDLRTFLIADLRGYTRYTRVHGDEAASKLTERFAAAVRATVGARGGEPFEFRGDEAMCVFGSARQALCAAVDLQRHLRAPDHGEEPFPVGVGVGLDAGEAVPTEDGFRGSALNLAARLCSIAGPGEVLASEAVVHLAQRVEGLRFIAARPARLKGFERPIPHVQIVPEEPLPPLPPPAAEPRIGPRRRWWRGAIAIAIAALVGSVAWSVLHESNSSSSATPTIHANSLVSIDPRTDALKPVVRLALGGQPARAAFGDGHVWTYNGDSQTVYGIDVHTHSVETQGIGLSPSDVTTSPGHVWITDPYANVLTDIDATSPNLQTRIPLDSRPAGPFAYTGPYQITADHQRIWVAHGYGFVVVDGNHDRVISPSHHRLSPGHLGPADVAIKGNQRWYSVFGHPPKVVEATPQHGSTPTTQSAACCGDLAIGFGYTWYASGHHVWKISPAPVSVADVIPVREDAEAITTGADSVWVADTAAGDVLKINPATDKVTRIRIGHPLGGIAYGARLIWVTVQGAG
jgi:class 3 adenylate cyclase/DNA-binding beta-propeller fold protein YncE